MSDTTLAGFKRSQPGGVSKNPQVGGKIGIIKLAKVANTQTAKVHGDATKTKAHTYTALRLHEQQKNRLVGRDRGRNSGRGLAPTNSAARFSKLRVFERHPIIRFA